MATNLGFCTSSHHCALLQFRHPAESLSGTDRLRVLGSWSPRLRVVSAGTQWGRHPQHFESSSVQKPASPKISWTGGINSEQNILINSSHLAKFLASIKSNTISKKTTMENLSWSLLKDIALWHTVRFLVGSALLIGILGLSAARPALARDSPLPTRAASIRQHNEKELNLNLEETKPESTGEEGEVATAPQSASDLKDDPAELVLLRVLQRHPDDLKALEGLMYVRLRKGDIPNALEVIDKMLVLRPCHTPWQLIRAQSLDFVGDLDLARQAYEAILEKDPLSARALQGLAMVMSKVGEGQEMLEMLRRAVKTALESSQAKEAKNLRMLLGQMHILQGNFQEALEQYQDISKEDPQDFRPYLCQGVVYTLLDKKLEAESSFRKYQRLCPKTFPERGYLDDLMLGAKTESRKLQERERLKPAKGKKAPKPLRQPNIAAFGTGAESQDQIDPAFGTGVD